MDPLKIIQKYYQKDSKSYNILVEHSEAVTKKALEIADRVPQLHPNKKFIAEASMLHDIGIFLINEPRIGCFGTERYVCHGVLGRTILEKEHLPKHALVCERHVGMGISLEDVEKNKLPLPKRDMIPLSVEEEIICLADKLSPPKREWMSVGEGSLNEIKKDLSRFGEHKIKKLNELLKKYGF